MNHDEAKAHLAQQNAELAQLEAHIGKLATEHAGPVMMALLRVLIETVCRAKGDMFVVHYKLIMYRSVLAMLRQTGIS